MKQFYNVITPNMPTRVDHEAFSAHTVNAAKGEADTIPIPSFGSSFGLMYNILERAQTSKAHPKLLHKLRNQLERLYIALYDVKQRVDSRVQQFSVGSAGRLEIESGLPRAVPLIARIDALNEELQKAHTLSLSLSRATWLSQWLFSSADSDILRELSGSIAGARSRFQSDGDSGIAPLVEKTLDELLESHLCTVHEDHILEALTSAVSTKTQHCWDGTYETLLEDIQSWVEGRRWPEKRVVFLRGAAGTGKSTLSVELCRRFEEHNTLGASFFFSREIPRLNSTELFFALLAVQLADLHPALRASFAAAARSYVSEHGSHQLESSYRELFKKPLSSLPDTCAPFVIIVDALDECTQQAAEHVPELLSHLLQGIIQPSSALRILITSRPEERYVREALDSPQFRESIQFVDIQPSPHDIHIFMRKELSTHDWSRLWCIRNPTLLKRMADEAHGWPLYARIAVQFLLSESPSGLDDPVRHLASEEMRSRLYTVLEDTQATELKDSDQDHTALLVSLLGYMPDPSESDVFPVSPRILGLLTKVPHTRIMDTLATFRSIVVYDPFDTDTQLRFIHPTCRGFLAHRTSSSPVRISAGDMESRLTVACARVILDSLGPSAPFIPPSFAELTARVLHSSPSTIPDAEDLQFAYRYLRTTRTTGNLLIELYDEEAAASMRRYNSLLAIGCVRAVLSYLDSDHTPSLFVDFEAYTEENPLLQKHPVAEDLLLWVSDEEDAALVTRFIDVVRDMLDDLYLWLFVALR
ncbi:hypothetical protein C8Q80DRAFT_1189860 [Daedaleopsis nitida]|nr:hypothetical protein C8Q80DRAFT_1189860 [Daedaleopsis nitida]